jgi:cell division septation protein DedD
VRRALSALVAVLVVTGCGSSKKDGAAAPSGSTAATPGAPASNAAEQSVCPSEQKAGIVAVFGHRRTTAAAQGLAKSAERVGFRGLVVQTRGCKAFAVVLPGLRSMRQAREFRLEARRAGFPVQVECRSHPVEGGLAAVFGHRRTRRAAVRLRTQAERVGFKGLKVQQDRCGDWEVDLYGINTPAQRREFAAQAKRAGFHVVYELG